MIISFKYKIKMTTVESRERHSQLDELDRIFAGKYGMLDNVIDDLPLNQRDH